MISHLDLNVISQDKQKQVSNLLHLVTGCCCGVYLHRRVCYKLLIGEMVHCKYFHHWKALGYCRLFFDTACHFHNSCYKVQTIPKMTSDR